MAERRCGRVVIVLTFLMPSVNGVLKRVLSSCHNPCASARSAVHLEERANAHFLRPVANQTQPVDGKNYTRRFSALQ